MTAVLPDYLITRLEAARGLAAALRAASPDAGSDLELEALEAVTSPEGLMRVQAAAPPAEGLAALVAERVAAVQARLPEDAPRWVPPLREPDDGILEDGMPDDRSSDDLLLGLPPDETGPLPPLPPLPERRDAVLDAFAEALRTSAPGEYEELARLYVFSRTFAEVEIGRAKGPLAERLAQRHPEAAVRLLEVREALVRYPGFLAPLLLAGCRYFAANRYFVRLYELCRFHLDRIDHPEIDRTEVLDYLWNASFRLGRRDEAFAALEEWAALKPTQKRPMIFRAIVTAVTDPDEAVEILADTGADQGRSTVGGNVLYTEYKLRTGEIRGAERAIRLALSEAERQKTRPSVDYLIALHNVLVRKGTPSRALDLLFSRHGATLRWDRFGMDTVSDASGPVPDQTGKVAVVMTAYDARAYIGRAMAGVLGQTHRDLELIVVDDNSTDDTAEVVRAVGDPRVRYMRTARNVGTYAAKNAGIARALEDGCDFVTLCDSDDFWLRNHLAAQLEALAVAPEAACSTSQWVRVRDDGTIECGLRGRYIEVCPHSTLFRAEVFGRTGLFDAVRFGADREFVNRMLLHFGRDALVNVSRILTLGRRHGASLTTSGAGAITEFNESPIRLDYWRNWNEWHMAEMAAGRKPWTGGDPDAAERPFPAPPEMAI